MGPNAAFCLILVGVLGIYVELIRPGRALPGMAGAAAAVTGGYFLWRAGTAAIGWELLAAATLLFLLDAFVETFYVAATVATIFLALGFSGLIAGGDGIKPGLAIPCCVAFGAITTGLNKLARLARRNKRVDLAAGE